MTNGKRKNVSKLSVTVSLKAGDWRKSLPDYRKLIKQWAIAALSGHTGELAIVLGDDAFVQDLNHRFRGRNKPTNVLSFTSNEHMGDIVLAYETIKAEAKAQNKTFKAHTAHLVVHGCQHLLGFDHETAKEATIMEKREVEILALLGFSNPYKVKN